MQPLVLLTTLLALTGAVGLANDEDIEPCSMPWFIWVNDSCRCGRSLGGLITCTEEPDIQLSTCYCMTVDTRSRETSVGVCPYTCETSAKWYQNQSELNYHMCSEVWNRKDRLCSQCIDGHGPLVYSYSLQCVECSHSVVKRSILYFLLSFLLLTVFCLTIITLRISVARPPMSTFVLVCQVMTSPQYMTWVFENHKYDSQYVSNSSRIICWKVFTSLFSIWNLDIFRSFYPNMCLSPNMSTTKAHSLEFLVALFPLAVILITFILGNIHYCRGYGVIYSLCKPVIFALTRLRQTLNIQVSLVDALVTFIILSVIKVGYTSVILLQPVYVYTPYGNFTTKVYIDPSITYFGWDHLPYALAAIVLSVVLIVIPLLLLFLYPLKLFQRFLNNCQWQCSTLHIFADSFQGCYKNGTNGTRDYRWFAGLHLLLRFIIVLFHNSQEYKRSLALFMAISTSFYMVLLVVCQPYKKALYVKLDTILLFGLLLWTLAYTGLDMADRFYFGLFLSILSLSVLVTLVYIVGVAFYWMIILKKVHMRILTGLSLVFHRNGDQTHLLQ